MPVPWCLREQGNPQRQHAAGWPHVDVPGQRLAELIPLAAPLGQQSDAAGAIECRNVSRTPERRRPPSIASFTIPHGASVGIVARRAGKSTIVDVVLGLLTPTSGQVLVDGRDTAGWRSWRRRSDTFRS
jgi:ABC-type multidrug transport system fused ATPase/permease subunit